MVIKYTLGGDADLDGDVDLDDVGIWSVNFTGELGGASPSNTFFAGQTTTTYWYAPAARAIVKSVHHNPYQGTTTVVLVDFKLSK